MTDDEEEQWIRKAVESFKKTTGKVPVGWVRFSRSSHLSSRSR